TYTEKLWGLPCTEIRAEWAAQRIQGLSLMRAILSATSLQKRSVHVKSLIEQFRYPRLGPGQMWERAAERIEELGGRVLMSHRVQSFEIADGEVEAVVVDTPDGAARIEGEHFISTIPLRSLVRSMDPPAPAAVGAAGDRLAYRDFILVALILDRENIFPDNWIYVHTPGVKVGRIQNFNNWSREMVPRPGTTCVGMEYFCFAGDGLWNSPDDELIALAGRELAQLGLAPNANVIDGTVVRMPKAYPIYDATYRESVDTIREHLDGIPNLVTVGRNGMHKYNNQDHSMYTAMLALENMAGASHDLWAVNTDLEYHEEQRIEPEPVDSNEEAAA
ncbi:MAG TPA: FAD-dependent oxidoreductase, partial [Gemmatimonadaceae bacterium]|nr:FAD-dependent oxidoreductase [Gemmatimonadaceae bacterium]